MLQQLRDAVLHAQPLEVLAVMLGLGYSVLAVRRRRACWIAGGLSSLLFIGLFAAARLPMQAALQLYYVAMALYGWQQWSRPGARLTRWPWRVHALAGLGATLLSWPLAAWLASETHAAWPYLDSFTTLASLVATWLTARGVVESWLWWIVIDALLMGVVAAQGLALAGVLYAVYLAVAVAGFRTWRQQAQALP